MLKKEHLLHYMMKGEIHLSKKDYSFFNNLNYIIKEKNQVTSNQNRLFDKLIIKYQRQLRKLGHEVEKLQELKWQTELVETSEEYTIPKIYLDDNYIYVRVPFNNNFIQKFTAMYDNTFEWQREERLYRSKFYTHSLRSAIDLSTKYFDKVDYCDKIKELIEPLKVYEGVSTVPTLEKIDGKFQITNLNKHLAAAIKDIELNDDPKTLYRLSMYGVSISKDITNNDPFLLFASEYITEIDLDVIIQNPQYLSNLGITDVFYPLWNSNNRIDKEIREFCKDNNIKVHHTADSFETTEFMVYFKRYSGVSSKDITRSTMFNKKIDKCIQIVNSRPVDVK